MIAHGLDSLVLAGFSYAGLKHASVRLWPGHYAYEPIVRLDDTLTLVAGEILHRRHGPWQSWPFDDRMRWYAWYRHLSKRLPDMLEKHEPNRLAINLSSRQAADSGILALLMKSPFLNQLIIEWTEAMPNDLNTIRSAGENLNKLRDAGAMIVLDDAGSGHDWMDRLQYASATWIKIDGKLFQGASDRPGNQEDVLCRSITDTAHSLGLKVVAEWVERLDHIEYARRISCDMGQGRFFSSAL